MFKGNIRGKDPSASYKKMRERLRAEVGDKYDMFQLLDGEDKPLVVVLPTGAGLDAQLSRFTEVWLAVLFAICTAVTTFNSSGVPLLEFAIDPFGVEVTQQDLVDAVPGVLALFFALGAHDVGHYVAAARQGVSLYLPLYIPAGFGLIGSFGSISRVRGFVNDRESLLDLAVTGPIYGAAASLGLVLTGFALTSAGVGCSVGLDTPSFADSFLMAGLAQLFVSGGLSEPVLQVNPLLIAGWSGLIANSLNSIPTGELDGARMGLALWGRRLQTVVSLLVQVVLGFSAVFGSNALSFAWVLLVVALQRGPILPCREELSQPKSAVNRNAAMALMVLSLAVLVPFPIELAYQIFTGGPPNMGLDGGPMDIDMLNLPLIR